MSITEILVDKSNPKRFINLAERFIKNMRDNEIIFAYEGEITQQIVLAFSALAESSLSKVEDLTIVQRRVYYVIIECLQNVTKHAEDFKMNNSVYSNNGIFLITKSESEYAITTGNPIDTSKCEVIRQKIDLVNSLNKEQLSEMYMKQVSEGELSDEGGAGLGFIDIVRRTGRKLDYQFLNIDEKVSFFMLTSFISRQ